MLTLKQSFCRGILLLAALVWSVPVLHASVVLNSANFPDPIFRAYISQRTGGKGNNKLFRLDLSKNPMLERVCCEYNNLTALVVSNLPKLRVLHCRSNKLASLNLTNNPQLKSLDCRLNQLTYVNL